MENENKMKWDDAMQDEMKSLHLNHSFELVKLLKEKRALKNRWVYKVKQEEHTSHPRYKAKLVVKRKVLTLKRFFLLLLRCHLFV